LFRDESFFSLQVLLLTRKVIGPWLYFVLHRKSLVLKILSFFVGAPIMAFVVFFDILLTAFLYLIRVFGFLVFLLLYIVTFACCGNPLNPKRNFYVPRTFCIVFLPLSMEDWKEMWSRGMFEDRHLVDLYLRDNNVHIEKELLEQFSGVCVCVCVTLSKSHLRYVLK